MILPENVAPCGAHARVSRWAAGGAARDVHACERHRRRANRNQQRECQRGSAAGGRGARARRAKSRTI